MDNKNFEEMQKSSNLWAESGYSDYTSAEGMVSVSNNIPNIIAMNNEPIIVNINSDMGLQKNIEEESSLNKK